MSTLIPFLKSVLWECYDLKWKILEYSTHFTILERWTDCKNSEEQSKISRESKAFHNSVASRAEVGYKRLGLSGHLLMILIVEEECTLVWSPMKHKEGQRTPCLLPLCEKLVTENIYQSSAAYTWCFHGDCESAEDAGSFLSTTLSRITVMPKCCSVGQLSTRNSVSSRGIYFIKNTAIVRTLNPTLIRYDNSKKCFSFFQAYKQWNKTIKYPIWLYVGFVKCLSVHIYGFSYNI
jgi:hypothetical protein